MVGSANVSSSIFAMLFVGWLVGLAMGAGLAIYMRTRQSRTRESVSEASVYMYVLVQKCMHTLSMKTDHRGIFLRLCRLAAAPSVVCMRFNRCVAAQKPVPSWAQSIRHAKTPSAAIRDEAVRTSGAEGPLGVGLVFQSKLFLGRLTCLQSLSCG